MIIMDGDDEEDRTRHGIFGGRMPWMAATPRRWMATTKKMERDMAFLEEECPGGVVATKRMESDDKVDGC